MHMDTREKSAEIHPLRMRDLVAHAIEFYQLENVNELKGGRETIQTRIRREVRAENKKSKAAGKGDRFEQDKVGYRFSKEDMCLLIEIKLFEYFLEKSPDKRADHLRLIEQTRNRVAQETEQKSEQEADARHRLQEMEDVSLGLPTMPHEALDMAELKTMLTLLIDKLYDPRSFDLKSFEKDFRELWNLRLVVDYSNIEGRVRIEQLRKKLDNPQEYLVSPESE